MAGMRVAPQHWATMEPTAGTSEDVPALYRSILALVGELERCDGRPEAARIRTQALATYAEAWARRRRRQLEHLEGRLRRSIASHSRPQRRALHLP